MSTRGAGRGRLAGATLVMAAAVVGVVGCTPAGGAETTPAASASEALTEDFPYGSFADPTTIDNQWLPITPGTRWTWEGRTVVDGEAVPHRIVLTVTDLTKVVDGVQSVVAYDEDYSDGELVEAEIFFLAQDDEGNVWRMGEYPEEYEGGEFVDAPTWLAGVQGALAGYWMTANPQLGDRSYAQGWGPEVGWADRGQVVQMGVQDCVALACYENVLVIEEWALDDPDARQLKYYAAGVGNIRVGWGGSREQEQETLELITFEQLGDADLEEVRTKAFALEEHAYEIRPEVFGETEPMQGA